MVISEGLAVGSTLGGIGSGLLTRGAIVYRIAIGAFSTVGAYACSGLVIRAYEWPREFDVEMGVSFMLAIIGISAIKKILDEIKDFSVASALGGIFRKKD